MNEAFGNLTREKQEKVINAALTEFAKHGYKKASTDNIVREAGIGKGMLFYYFKSKRELFVFLIEYATAISEDYFSRLINSDNLDLIEHFRISSKLKLDLCFKHPLVIEFLTASLLNINGENVPDEARQRIADINDIRQKTLDSIYSRVDTSLFREDFPPEKIMHFIKWSMDGYMNYILASVKPLNVQVQGFEKYFKDFDEYLDDMKKIFYK